MKTNRWRNRILWMAFLVCLVLIFCLTAFHRPILNGKESESSSDQKHKVVFIAKSTVSGFWTNSKTFSGSVFLSKFHFHTAFGVL